MSAPGTEPPAVPEWAEKTLRALGDASIYGCGNLTPAEESLLDAAWLLLRDRFGRSGMPDVPQAVQFLIRNAQADLDAMAAGRRTPDTTTAPGDPAPKAAEQAHIN